MGVTENASKTLALQEPFHVLTAQKIAVEGVIGTESFFEAHTHK